jgi:23S rRNA (uracil-5-)-methyltransferase RumA
MKKGEVLEGVIERVLFPNKGIVHTENNKQVIVKNGVPGQKVRFSVNKIKKGKAEGRLLEVLEKAPNELEQPACVHFGECGGCTYQNLSYEDQLSLKEEQVHALLDAAITDGSSYQFDGIKRSPHDMAYRNKMEYTFGDEYMDGPLSLGMHKRGSFYDIVCVEKCKIVSEDYNRILKATVEYFRSRRIPHYHRMRHTGFLRHLLVRRGERTGELLVDVITTTQAVRTCREMGEEEPFDVDALLEGWKECLLSLSLSGTIVGILHTKNDSVADAVKNEGTSLLYGQDYFYEEILGLRFQITPFSFFQTNSLGAEVLYDTARQFIGEEGNDKVIFDLYSGTGTIAQILAPVAKKVIGVEIVEEAVEAAKENAHQNGLDNCEFLAGDVLKVLADIEEKPDFIVLDPPRDGIHPKALQRIIDYGVDHMLYISCKPTSLARDLEVLQARGYEVTRLCLVDMFPGTVHVETVCLLSKKP